MFRLTISEVTVKLAAMFFCSVNPLRIPMFLLPL